LREHAAKKVNWEYQSESDGVTINIAGLVQSTDFDRVADMAIETCESNQKAKDIAKLAKACGANDEQAKKAVAAGLVLVSQIMSLINS